MINAFNIVTDNPINKFGLGGYYPLNGNSMDFSGNGFNSTSAASISYSEAVFSSGATFNGTSSNISISDQTQFEGSGNSLSVFAWVNLTDFASDAAPHIASKWGTTTGWRLVPRAADILVTLGNTNITKGTGVATGTPVFIGFTYDNVNCVIYQNGVSAGTIQNVGTKTMANTLGLMFGKRNNGNDGYLKGTIDDISVWQRVLTRAEIGILYSGNTQGFRQPIIPY